MRGESDISKFDLKLKLCSSLELGEKISMQKSQSIIMNTEYITNNRYSLYQ